MLKIQTLRSDVEGSTPEEAGGVQIAREFSDPRLEAIRILHEACEIEHSLMLQYLYAAYSIRDRYADVAGDSTRPDTLLGVAAEEMAHLRDVNRMLVELGGSPNLARQDFPYEPGIYPFRMQLERLSRESVAQYVFAEAPPGAMDLDGSHPKLAADVRAALSKRKTGDQPRNHVGSIYRTLILLMKELGASGRYPQWERWIAKLNEIQAEGEQKHFDFFHALFRGNVGSMADVPEIWSCPADDPRYPSRDLPTKPSVPRGAATMTDAAAELARIGNLAYWAALLFLDHSYRNAVPGERPPLLDTAVGLMENVLGPLARLLASRGEGLPFDPLSIGYAPCQQPAENLSTAALLLHEGAARAAALSEGEALDGVVAEMETAELLARDAAQATGRVVVVGAGPAGLAAAFALADRGLPVHLLELSPVVGGKVYSEEVGVERRSVEHGVHGWWSSYLNFYAILEKSGVDLAEAFVGETRTNLVVDRDHIVEMKPVSTRYPSPIFLAAQLLRAEYAGGWSTLFRMIPFTIHALAFRHEKDYPRYDVESLEDFLERVGVPEVVRDRLFRPFALNFAYVLPKDASAAAILSAFQFYVLPSRDALLPRWTRGLPQRLVFGPIVKAIEGRSGRVETSAAVLDLGIENGVLHSVRVEDVGGPTAGDEGVEVLLGTLQLAGIPESGWGKVEFVEGGFAFVRRTNDGAFQAFAPRCTHHGGHLELDPGTQRFKCQKHTGIFDQDGEREDGPPKEPLTSLTIRPEGEDHLRIYGRRQTRTLSCADVVLATDLRAARGILESSEGVPDELRGDLAKLETTPVLVVRMWFLKGTKITGADYPTAVTKACELVDNYFHLNRIDPSYDREGEVIEVQGARCSEAWGEMRDADVVAWVLADLKKVGLMLPSVGRPIHHEVIRHPEVFTRYAPGAARHRPGADSGVAGLHLAGDWTSADWSAWFMERAIISGLRAANSVLEARGLEPFEIRRMPKEGLVLRLSRAGARVVRALFFKRSR